MFSMLGVLVLVTSSSFTRLREPELVPNELGHHQLMMKGYAKHQKVFFFARK